MPASTNLLIALNTILRVISCCLNKWCTSWFATANNELFPDYSAKEQLEAIEDNPYENMARVVSKEIRTSLLKPIQSFQKNRYKLMLRLNSMIIDDSLRKSNIQYINHRETCSSMRLTTCHRQKDSGSVFAVYSQLLSLYTSRLVCLPASLVFQFPMTCINRMLSTYHIASACLSLFAEISSPQHFLYQQSLRLPGARQTGSPPLKRQYDTTTSHSAGADSSG